MSTTHATERGQVRTTEWLLSRARRVADDRGLGLRWLYRSSTTVQTWVETHQPTGDMVYEGTAMLYHGAPPLWAPLPSND